MRVLVLMEIVDGRSKPIGEVIEVEDVLDDDPMSPTEGQYFHRYQSVAAVTR